MANQHVSHDEVMKIVHSLECSPSMHDNSGHYGGKPKIMPGGEATSSHEKTSEFQHKGVPGYKSKFAKGARQE